MKNPNTRKLPAILIVIAVFGLLAWTAPAQGQMAPGSICWQADLNGDGTVGVEDLLVLLSEWGNTTADLNCDGVVNGADAGILIDNFGFRNPQWYHGDLNGNGRVGFEDLRILLGHTGVPSADLLCNGTVGVPDLKILLSCWRGSAVVRPDLDDYDVNDPVERERLIRELRDRIDRRAEISERRRNR